MSLQRQFFNSQLSTRFVTFTLCITWVLFALVSAQVAKAQPLNDVVKSPNDSREYRAMRLDNQLKVILVSDPSSKTAAASLDVDVGSALNPKGREGLAHFLEHMLFLGTQKYPEAGDYQAFISNHGGSHNAFTSNTNTNYHFDIDANYLEPALDRFAQFFIAPLFTPEYVDREKHAVHSEYQSNLNQDGRRVFAATRQAYNPEHPFSRFAVGSLETLADRENSTIRDELIAFYNTYYSANLMSLVVVGPQSLDELSQLVTTKFSAVANREVTLPKLTTPLFLPDSLPAQINIATLRDVYSMSLTFPTPSDKDDWQAKPLSYLGAEFGYEGEGSLLALFKEKGWANALAASPGFSFDNEASFRLDLQLTEEGFKHTNEILQYIFDFASKLEKDGIRNDLFEEEKALSQASFLFQDAPAPLALARYLAQQHQAFDAADVLRAPYAYDQFKPERIAEFLSYIRPDNVLIALKAKNIDSNATSPYFNVPYQFAPLTDEQQALIAAPAPADASALFVRSSNPFVSDNYAVLEAPQGQDKEESHTPTEVLSEQGLEVWYADNRQFKQPKADIFVSLLNPAVASTPELGVVNDLWVQLINDDLTSLTYDAHIAGLSSEIYPHMRGISIKLSGFSQPLPRLYSHLMAGIASFTPNPQRFAVLKARMAQQIANSLKENAYKQTLGQLYQGLLNTPSVEDRLAKLASLTLEDIKRHHQRLLKQSHLRLLVHGNLTEAQAIAMGEFAKSQFEPSKALKPLTRLPVTKLDIGRMHKAIDAKQNNAAITVYNQANGDKNDLTLRASYSVLSDALAPAFYTRLRTEQQLGYVVFSMPLNLLNSLGITMVIESPTSSPQALEGHIDNFVTAFSQAQLTMPEQVFEGHKQSVIAQLSEPATKQSELTNRWWTEIDQYEANFEINNQRINAVRNLDKATYLSHIKGWLDRQWVISSEAQRF